MLHGTCSILVPGELIFFLPGRCGGVAGGGGGGGRVALHNDQEPLLMQANHIVRCNEITQCTTGKESPF